MKLHYYSETDSLYIELRDAPWADTREIAAGLNADFDEPGNVVGLDIDGASTKLDLGTLEAIALPFASLKAAKNALNLISHHRRLSFSNSILLRLSAFIKTVP